MWYCLCPLFRRPGRTSAQLPSVATSRSPPTAGESNRSGSFVLTGFSNDVNRRTVIFAPPVPVLTRCSLCGMVPPRLYTNEACQHKFCSLCVDYAQPECPFDGSTWISKTADTATAESVSRAAVFCWNRTEGCTYKGFLLDMACHYQRCPYYKTQCSLCGQGVRMKDLPAHVKHFCSFSQRLSAERPSASAASKNQRTVMIRSSENGTSYASQLQKADFIWTIKPYSKIRHGVHYFRSEPFLSRRGHMMQLLGAIKADSAVQLKAAVRLLPRCEGQNLDLTNPHENASFCLMKNDTLKRTCGTKHSDKTAHLDFKNDVSVNAWHTVAKLEKCAFEKEFVRSDAFVLKFIEA